MSTNVISDDLDGFLDTLKHVLESHTLRDGETRTITIKAEKRYTEKDMESFGEFED
jgi:hypothetical protein